MATKYSYKLPKWIVDPPAHRREATRRRQALIAGGCSTYVIGVRGGVAAIVCLCCALGSTNVDDINNLYCGFCKEFHSEAKEESAT